MSTWRDELSNIGAAEELQIASVGRDGTLRHPATFWVVRHGDDVYVRSIHGRGSSWFRGAQAPVTKPAASETGGEARYQA
jgi:hypothetical protein